MSQLQKTVLSGKTLLKHAQHVPWVFLHSGTIWNPDFDHCDCTITQTQETKKEKGRSSPAFCLLFSLNELSSRQMGF